MTRGPNRDMDWERFVYYFERLPKWRRILFRLQIGLLTLRMGKLIIGASFLIFIFLILIDAQPQLTLVCGMAIGATVVGLFLIWLFKDLLSK